MFSELDAGRAERLLELLPAGQALLTTAVAPPPGLRGADVVDVGGLHHGRDGETAARDRCRASLHQLAARVRRVDLLGFAGVEAAWPAVASAAASGRGPVRLANRELVVAVPSGAHAARARRDAAAMLAELAPCSRTRRRRCA